jgi:hypothetical protein
MEARVDYKNSLLVLFLFAITLLFQVTGLKFIWSLENTARIINLLVLFLLIAYSGYNIGKGVYPKNVWTFYLLPGLIIFFGIFFNVTINVFSNFKLISYYGQTLPWLVYLIIPPLLKKRKINTRLLWRYYYYFLLIINILGILEYVLVSHGILSLRLLKTPYGVYLAGYFSILHMLSNGTAYFRYYSCFIEPGTLAMFLLPAISYAFFNKKYFGLLIFLISFYLTFSLGGIISLLMLVAIISFLLLNGKKNNLLYTLFGFFIVTAILLFNFSGSIAEKYKKKDLSAKVREQNISSTITNLPVILMTNPMGLTLATDTESFEQNPLYVGSNFSPITYLEYGGAGAFLGYLLCLTVSFIIALKSIKRNDLSMEEKVVFSSILVLLPFIVQRTTIWESALFGLLFAPSILRVIEKRRITKK